GEAWPDPDITDARQQLTPVDSDGDGVPDGLDQCPNTPVGAAVNAEGCSIEQLCPCDGPWRNHGEYVHCLNAVTALFHKDGFITDAGRRALLKQGTSSECGKAY